MSGDPLQPGEIDLEDIPSPAALPAPAAGDPAPSQTTDDPSPSDEPASGDPPADPAAPPKRQPSGAVGELIQLRKESKQLRERLQQIESSPVLQRLTPEIQQAILDGRVQIAPPQSTREAEKERLTSVAEQLGLVKQDGTPDLDAAKRVDTFVRGTVQQAVEPVRQGTLAEKANENYARAIAFAEQNGFDVETVQEVFDEIRSQPNGAELLAQRKVAERMWETAVGRMHTRGKATGNGKKPGAAAVDKPPAAVITEPTGRRGGSATTVQLSPTLAKVYKDAGVDPSKSFTATKQINLNGPIDLE